MINQELKPIEVDKLRAEYNALIDLVEKANKQVVKLNEDIANQNQFLISQEEAVQTRCKVRDNGSNELAAWVNTMSDNVKAAEQAFEVKEREFEQRKFEVAKKEEALMSWAQSLTNQVQQIEERKGLLQIREKELENRGANLEDLKKTLAERERADSQSFELLTKRSNEIVEQSKLAKAENDRLLGIATALDEREKLLNLKRSDLVKQESDFDIYIGNLKRQKEQIVSEEMTLKQKAFEIEKKAEEVLSKEKNLEAQERELATKDANLRMWEKELKVLASKNE